MNSYRKTGFIFLLAFALLFPMKASLLPDAVSAEKSEVLSVKGKVLSFANPDQSKSISVAIPKKGIMVFKYDNSTEFGNFKYITELKGSGIKIKYKTEGTANIATVITKAYVKLPKGVREIKTGEVASIIQMGPIVGKYTLVDARPVSKYGEGHIPSSMSIPVAKFKQMGQELLSSDKDRHIIFYCGGPT